MRSFDRWKNLTKELAEEHNLDKPFVDQLLSAITNGHNYIRNYYKHSLDTKSSIGSHCINFCLSDIETANTGEYSSLCDHQHDQCFQCENIRKVSKALMHLLKSKEKDMDDLLFKERKKLILDGYDHIFGYQKQLIRSACQTQAWDSLHENNGETVLVVQGCIYLLNTYDNLYK